MANEINAENQEVSLDDLVFQNRNHEYGAYDLRKSYRWLLTKSFLFGVLFFVLAIGIPFVYLKVKAMNEEEQTNVNSKLIDIVEQPIIEKPEEKKEEPKPEPPKVEKVEVIKDVVPEPKAKPEHEDPPPTKKEKEDTNTGVIPVEGPKKKVDNPPVTPTPDPGTGKPDPKPDPKPIVDNTVHTDGNIDVKAQFPGGDNGFRQTFMDAFDQDILQDVEQNTRIDVSFVVEKDGSMSDVQATGPNRDFNAEAIKTVKSIRKKWAPGKNAGQPVRMRYKMAVSITPP